LNFGLSLVIRAPSLVKFGEHGLEAQPRQCLHDCLTPCFEPRHAIP
jgi:hypothetical protein